MLPRLPSFCPTKSKAMISPNSSKSHHHNCLNLFIFITFVFSILSTASSSSNNKTLYKPHCNSVVEESPSTGEEQDPSSFLYLQSAYYVGGETLLPSKSPQSYSFFYPKSVDFRTSNIYSTKTPGIFKIQAKLIFRGGGIYSFENSSIHFTGVGSSHYQLVRPRSPRIIRQRGRVTFDFEGFWSESSGKLCMVGTGFGYSKDGNLLDLSAVFKLNYPKKSNITTSLVTGTVESVDAVGDSNYFDRISVLAFVQKTYEYTLVKEGESLCDRNDGGSGEESLGLARDVSVCTELLRLRDMGFQLQYEGDCSKKNCSIFNHGVEVLPTVMTVGGVQCSDKGRLRMFLQFSNSSFPAYRVDLAPEMMLVGEGVWDGEKNRVCFVGCRVLNFEESLDRATVGDCSIGLNLRFPKILSVRVRSFALGSIWSNKNANESGYFDRFLFRSWEKRMMNVSGLEYNYTEIRQLGNLCEKKDVKKSGKRFPDGYSYQDMRFDVSVKSGRRTIAWGYSTPLTIGNRFYDDVLLGTLSETPVVEVPGSSDSLLNVSYMVSFTLYNYSRGGLTLNQTSSDGNVQIEIYAEGLYNAATGNLCMVGCRYLGLVGKLSDKTNDTMDCAIVVSVQFAPLNPEAGKHLKGTIKSTRENSDSFYFEPLELSSYAFYEIDARRTVSRMDLEIIMVLISLMLACVFIGFQLCYVKKHPNVLPSISLIMLVVLTLGHMIPLVLNFEALFFSDRNRQNVLLWSGGWLEVNEVIVRVVTMVAFLLQCRLLQITWSARLADEGKRGLWVAEKKALHLCLPLYIVGGLIAVFIHWKVHGITQTQLMEQLDSVVADSQHSIWEDLRSYAGLILDGFLLPQIFLNLFWGSKDKALAPSFYIGTTIVRSLPHAYDAYRAHKYAPRISMSYIYADPDADLYSPAWDIIIPCGGFLFAVIVYLQQRFGGALILPRRYRQSVEYEKVPVANG